MELVDAHHHLFDLSGAAGAYPGLRGPVRKTAFGTDEPLRRDYLVEQYASDMREMGAAQSVHVEAGRRPDDPVEETRWLAGVSTQTGLPTAFVAQVDLTREDASDVVAEHCSERRVRGVRQIKGISGSLASLKPEDTLYAVESWRRNLAVVALRGLACELQAPPTVAAIACECVDEWPEIEFVLTHCGHPIDRSADGKVRWLAALELFASRPNVVVKLSGFYMMNPNETADGLSELVAEIVDRFGPSRCMFGSNYPVDRLFAGPAKLRDVFDTAIGRYAASERAEICSGTATRTYRLDTLTSEEC